MSRKLVLCSKDYISFKITWQDRKQTESGQAASPNAFLTFVLNSSSSASSSSLSDEDSSDDSSSSSLFSILKLIRYFKILFRW